MPFDAVLCNSPEVPLIRGMAPGTEDYVPSGASWKGGRVERIVVVALEETDWADTDGREGHWPFVTFGMASNSHLGLAAVSCRIEMRMHCASRFRCPLEEEPAVVGVHLSPTWQGGFELVTEKTVSLWKETPADLAQNLSASERRPCLPRIRA